MKKIWLKYKLSIIIGGYILLVAVATYFLVIPLVKNIKSLSYQIQAKAIDREIEKARIDKLPEIKKEWADYESRNGLLNVILGQQDQVSFIENIESMAQTSGNKIELKIADNAKGPSLDLKGNEILKAVTYPDYFLVKIGLTGDYAGLVKFIHLLENGGFYVNIISISSVKNSVENGGNQNPFMPTDSSATNSTGADINQGSIKTDITAIVYIQKQ